MPHLRSGAHAAPKPTAELPNQPPEDKRQAPNLNPNSTRHDATATREEIAAALVLPDARDDQIALEEGVGDNNGVQLAIAEKKMDEFDSGARSGDNKLAAAEDEGSTAPLPETVRGFSLFFL